MAERLVTVIIYSLEYIMLCAPELICVDDIRLEDLRVCKNVMIMNSQENLLFVLGILRPFQEKKIQII